MGEQQAMNKQQQNHQFRTDSNLGHWEGWQIYFTGQYPAAVLTQTNV